jgi:glycosyltransferase involved in cell wall biosynthesis
MNPQASIAVVIPCYQEEMTIGKVVRDFRRELPTAHIIVYDNNSTDRTAELAREAGAEVRRERRQGKGWVLATMFREVDADALVMVDGDDTYDASAVHALLKPILDGDADVTVASRLVTYGSGSFRKLHISGNRWVCQIVNWMFPAKITDIFSGYRAFTREAMGRIPVTAHGFDVETEITLQALYRGLVVREIEAPYGARPAGSFSKLRTFTDGSAVLLKLFLMIKSYKPLTFFGGSSLVLMALGLVAGWRPVREYLTEQWVYAVPRAILAAALIILSFLSLAVGLLLNSVNLRLLELETLIQARFGAQRPVHREPPGTPRDPEGDEPPGGVG